MGEGRETLYFACDVHGWFGVDEPGPRCRRDCCYGHVPLKAEDFTYRCGRHIVIESREPVRTGDAITFVR